MTLEWPTVKFGTLFVNGLSNGLSPSTKGHVEGRVLTLSAITRGTFDSSVAKDAVFNKRPSERQLARPGTFLIARGNGNLNLVGAGQLVRGDTEPQLIFPDTIIGGLVNESRVEPGFLRRVWATRPIRRQIERAARTTNGTHKVNQGSLSAVEVPLPPLAEQRRIAAILDKADAIRRKRREAIALTEELLRSTFLDMFGDPVTNPKGWPVVDLGTVTTFVGGGTPSRKVPKYFTGDICWATSKDMKGEYLHDTQEHVTREAIAKSATKLVDVGSVLIVVKSKVLMRRLPVLVTMVPTCFGQDLKAIVPQSGIPSRYVARHLRVGACVLLAQARGVNTEGLTLDHLRSYKLMAPPKRLMAKWVELEALSQKQLERQRIAELKTSNLFHSLVQRAFRGDL